MLTLSPSVNVSEFSIQRLLVQTLSFRGQTLPPTSQEVYLLTPIYGATALLTPTLIMLVLEVMWLPLRILMVAPSRVVGQLTTIPIPIVLVKEINRGNLGFIPSS